jgi:hypothetical protein
VAFFRRGLLKPARRNAPRKHHRSSDAACTAIS